MADFGQDDISIGQAAPSLRQDGNPADSFGMNDLSLSPVEVDDNGGILGTMKDVVTGDGRTEYPDMPEITEAEVGFFESIWPNLKLGLTLSPDEKTNIILDSFKGDKRLGGATKDMYGNPIIKWNGKPYYVNKPGFSEQDATDVIAQTAQYAVPSALLGKIGKASSRFAASLPVYGAIDAAQQAGTIASGGKKDFDLFQAGQTGLIGATAETVIPPLLRGMVKAPVAAVSAVTTRGQKAFKPTVSPGDPIPLTKGQRTGDINILRQEEAARHGSYGTSSSDMMRGFDKRQSNAISTEAERLQKEIGSGSGLSNDAVAGQNDMIRDSLISKHASEKKTASGMYDDIGVGAVQIPTRSAAELAKSLMRVPREMAVEVADFPHIASAMKRLRGFSRLAKGAKDGSPTDYMAIANFRKSLNSKIEATVVPTEKNVLRAMKGRLDEFVDDALDDALFSGDVDMVRTLKAATENYASFKSRFGDKTALGGLVKKILDPKKPHDARQVMNFLTGGANITSNGEAGSALKQIVEIFGPESEQVRALKDAFLLQSFTVVKQGDKAITPGAITGRTREMLFGKGREISDVLFSKQEKSSLNKFIDQVAKTITPADAMNPSKSGWVVMRLLTERGIIDPISRAVRFVPLMKDTGEAMSDLSGAMRTRRNINDIKDAITAPIFTSGGQGTARSVLE